MTFSEKVGYKVGSAVLAFKRWQITSWIKIPLVLAILSIFLYLLYLFFKTGLVIICGIAFFLFYFPSSNKNNISDNGDHQEDERDGYRDGHSGFGFYYGDMLIDENSNPEDEKNNWGNL